MPSNYILLFIFTFCEGYMVSIMTGLVDAKLVMIALVLTCGIFVSLTIYALTTKEDFTTCGAFLSTCLCILLLMGFLLIFIGSDVAQTLYSVAAVILFSVYVIYDTQLLMEDKAYKYSVDDYIMASLQLYLDFI